MVAPFAVAVAALLFSPASTAAAAPVSVSSLRPVRHHHAWSKEIHRSSLGASVGLGDFTWDCTQFSGDDQSMCGLCDQHWSLSGDCFWCSETSTCHDQTDWLFNDKAASCVEMACVSENGDDGCSGSCAQGTVPSGFSVPRAQSLLALANASIYQGKTLSIALQELGFPPGAYQVVANATLQAQAIVVPLPDSNAITIALRGKQFLSPNDTHILNDTLVNFTQAVSASQPNRTAAWQVGSGAAAAYGSLREQLHAAVEWAVGVVGPTRPAVYVTGHSLGGSIAEIAAPELALSSLSTSLDSVSVTTFGALRACNPVFAEQVTQLVPAWWTVQNFFDVFCHAPYRWLGFAHVPGIVVVGPNQGNVHEVTPADDDNYWVSDVADPLLFHQPAAYSTQLSALPGAGPGGRFALQRL